MIKLRKNFEKFEEVIDELDRIDYSDSVFEGFTYNENKEDLLTVSYAYKNYDEMLEHLLNYIIINLPSVSNTSFPNCINANISSYGFNYVKDNVGMGVSTRYNRKSGKITYSLNFNFDREEQFLANNNFYNYLIDEGYEIVKRK